MNMTIEEIFTAVTLNAANALDLSDKLGSIEVAIKKARAAVLFLRPTSIFAERVNNGQPGYLEMPGIMPLEGGEPLEYEGEIVGAIGISGARANEDGIVARAGAAVMPVGDK